MDLKDKFIKSVASYIDNKDDKFKGFDGLSEVVDGYPFICIASNINYYRQRFTLAHELGHLILDIDGSLNEEKVCNEFASSLLLSKKAMNLEFGIKRVYISDREFEIARDEYHMSIKAIIYSLERNGIITSSNAKSSYIKPSGNLNLFFSRKVLLIILLTGLGVLII